MFSLLFITEPTVYIDSHYGDGDGAIVYSNTSCKGYESSVIGCTKQLYGTFTCSRNNVVGIACQEGIYYVLYSGNYYYLCV